MGYPVCVFGAVLILAICTVEGGYHGHGGGYQGYHSGGYHGSSAHHHHYHDAVHNHWDKQGHGEGSEEGDDTVYRFAVGGNYGPYEYEDDTGRLQGFNIDLIYAVCAKAGKKCAWVMDKYTNCWAGAPDDDAELEYPGVGLLAGYYDACMGWIPTQERSNAFNFSISFAKNVDISLYYKQEAEGDLNDLTGKKVGLVSGWLWNQKCLAKQTSLKGNQQGEYTAVMFSNNVDMARALWAEEIDVAMGVKSHVAKTEIKDWVVAADPSFTCSTDGSAVMARYSRMDIIDWWNEAFEQMRGTGAFRRLCEQAQTDHGHKGEIDCAV